MRCSKCGSDNLAGKRFCADCGAPLANRCPKCGADNPPAKRFCGDCGTSLSASSVAPQSPASSRSAPESPISAEWIGTSTTVNGERKTVTALFADIKGSMELMEDLDPEEARAIIDPALKLMIEAVVRHARTMRQTQYRHAYNRLHGRLHDLKDGTTLPDKTIATRVGQYALFEMR
jgi:double zinc ribbon protein